MSDDTTPSGTPAPSGQAPVPSAQDVLAAALHAAGVPFDNAQLAALMPAYDGMRAGAARILALDLDGIEPVLVYQVPSLPSH